MLATEETQTAWNRQRAASFVPEGCVVLDVACGAGANAAYLQNCRRYFGVDLAISGLRRAAATSLRIACADADHLPFPDTAFDAAVATYVLEHSVAPAETLREMARVVRPGGRVILLGPAWDFPFWYPNSLRSKASSRLWRLRYALLRSARQLLAVLFGRLPFEVVDDPDALHSEFICDADAVYIVWTYEVICIMRKWGHKLVHWETDDPLLGTNPIVRRFKNLMKTLPLYRQAGSTVLLVFER